MILSIYRQWLPRWLVNFLNSFLEDFYFQKLTTSLGKSALKMENCFLFSGHFSQCDRRLWQHTQDDQQYTPVHPMYQQYTPCTQPRTRPPSRCLHPRRGPTPRLPTLQPLALTPRSPTRHPRVIPNPRVPSLRQTAPSPRHHPHRQTKAKAGQLNQRCMLQNN